MKRLLALFALAAFLIPAPSRASVTSIGAAAAGRYIITSASATSCTQIAYPAQQILAIFNAASSAQTVTISFYDESGGSPTCATADLIYSAVLGASQVISFPVVLEGHPPMLNKGLAYALSGSAANNIVVFWR